MSIIANSQNPVFFFIYLKIKEKLAEVRYNVIYIKGILWSNYACA